MRHLNISHGSLNFILNYQGHLGHRLGKYSFSDIEIKGQNRSPFLCKALFNPIRKYLSLNALYLPYSGNGAANDGAVHYFTRSGMKIILKTVAILSLIAFSVQSVNAGQDPCEADSKKYCPGYSEKDPMRLFCLKGISSQISSPCKATLRDVDLNAGESIEACSDDAAKLCGNVPPGNSRILKCLKANTKRLEFECRKKVVMFPDPK